MKKKYNLRSIAAQAIADVLDRGLSLSAILPGLQKQVSDKDAALLQELCFGILRTLPELEWYLQQLMAKVMTDKQRVLHYLLMVGIYQLLYTRIPPHAAVAETVNGAVALKRQQLKGLINGVMRQFQRQQQELTEQVKQTNNSYLHPSWLLLRLQKAYPKNWQQIVAANNQKPPMWLRVNRQYNSRDHYLTLLEQAGIEASADPKRVDAIRLTTPGSVLSLPGFTAGWVTVQDVSAQESVELLQPQNSDYILDLCAAPGGKTTYILEVAPQAKVLAVDIDEQRLLRVKENLLRLNQQAEVRVGDGRSPEMWCGNDQFDRILLDAPCSATGVIRRHPDIKWLRRDHDIQKLVEVQKAILNAIWPHLKSGGILIYATCSVLPDENSQQIEQFLANHCDAKLIAIDDEQSIGKQYLPSAESGDGFFYAKLQKTA